MRPLTFSTLRTLVIGLTLLVPVASPTLAADDEPAPAPAVVMVLEHVEGQGQKSERIQTKVEAKAGVKAAPMRGKPLQRIGILPGKPLDGNKQPADVMVDLHQGVDAGRTQLASIGIRYFRAKNGKWLPHYQLIETPLMARGPDGRWVPISAIRSEIAPLTVTSLTVPNAEGFYTSLEFGPSNGTIQIDSWEVRKPDVP